MSIGCARSLLVFLAATAWPAAASAGEEPGCTLVRSMADTFSGPDVGTTWGQLLLMGIDFADAKRGVVAGFNDATEIRFNNRFSGLLGLTDDGGRTFKVTKVGGQGQSKGPLWTVRHAAGDTFWAAGYNGLVMRSDDAGRTWKEFGCGRGYPSVQVDFRNADSGLLAVGDNGHLFATDDGGKAFREIATPAKDVRAVAMGTGGFGVAAGCDGDLLVTSDGGTTWAYPAGWRIPGEKGGEKNRLGTWFRAAAAIGDKYAWVAGDAGTVLRTVDAGKSFEVVTIPGGEFLTAVRFADADHGWALGWHFAYRTSDGGKTWLLQPSAGGTNLNGLAVLDANTAWIAGHYGCVQQTTDGGKTWATLNDYSDLHAVTMVSDRIGYAGAESGAILRTDDGGRTWLYPTVPRGKPIEAIHFIDAGTGWAVGDWGHIVRTTDGGQTWSACNSDFNDVLKDVHFFDRTHGIVVGARGTILLTDDGGDTWQPTSSPTSRMLYAVDFPARNTGFACGKGVVIKTLDGGRSWLEIKSRDFEDDIFEDIRFANERLGLMVGDYGMIYRTEDGGQNWTAQPQHEEAWSQPRKIPNSTMIAGRRIDVPLHHIDAAGADTFYIAGSRGTILRSTDGGVTWGSIKAAVRNNVYSISRGVAVGRWGQVQLISPEAKAAPLVGPIQGGPASWRVAQDTELEMPPPRYPVTALPKFDDKGRLIELEFNGSKFPVNGQFPTFTVLTLKDGKPDQVKTLKPDDPAWKRSAESKRAPNTSEVIMDSELLKARISYEGRFAFNRLRVTVKILEEKQARVLRVSAGEEFVRLTGDTPDSLRNGALAVPVDGGELIPFTGFATGKNVLRKSNNIGGWTFKNRMISLADGRAGLVLRSLQWHATFHYGQSFVITGAMPIASLYMGWSFDTRLASPEHVAKALNEKSWGDNPPAWLSAPMPYDELGFDLIYVGDRNGDKTVNWVDSAIAYRDGCYVPCTWMKDSPGLCDTFPQAQTLFMLWDNPFIGNAHADSRALKRAPGGRPSYQWGAWSRSIAYEWQSGRLQRFFDKLADDFDFPPAPCHFGSDTWTCGAGGTDFSPDHPSTREESIRAKVDALRLLARRGYATDSEALSEWGLAGNLLWGWWTPYVGNGCWPGGFTRCWEHIPPKEGLDGPVVSSLFGKPIPLQTVLFQGMTYHGAGAWTSPAFAILNGSRPTDSGIQGLKHPEFLYYQWLVLWKTVSPLKVQNVRELMPDLWEFTYGDGTLLKLDVRANSWVLQRNGITYDGCSPANPTSDPRKAGSWGLPYENFEPPFPKGSFAVWRSGTFKIKVDGVTRVKSVRVVGGPPDAKPPQFSTSSGRNSLTVKIKGKDPLVHPMLVFNAE